MEVVLEPIGKHVRRPANAPVDFGHTRKFDCLDFGRVRFWIAAQHAEIDVDEFVFRHAAAKFALVAMYYMHLKQDSRLFTGVFVFPLIIAVVIIVALILLEAYHFAFARSG